MGVEDLLRAVKAASPPRKLRKTNELVKLDDATKARAQEMGYDTDIVFFHGTGSDVVEFSVGRAGSETDGGFFGKGIYLSQSPKVASAYANIARFKGKNANVIPTFIKGKYYQLDSVGEGTASPLTLKTKLEEDFGEEFKAVMRPHEDEKYGLVDLDLQAELITDFLSKKGFNGVKVFNQDMDLVEEVVVFDPSHIRSVFAKFDKERAGSAQLTAGVGGAGVVAAQEGEAADFSPFESVLAEVENAQRVGFKDGLWHPHASPEGGRDTIGYGHKLTKEDAESGRFDKGISDEEAISLFRNDIQTHKEEVRRNIKDFDQLPPKYQDVLVNIAFNTGTVTEKEWPNLLAGMRGGDDAAVRAEMVTSFTDENKKTHKLLTRARKVADAVGLENDD